MIVNSSTSTPYKAKKSISTSQSNSPTKALKKDISTIIEEKENPSNVYHQTDVPACNDAKQTRSKNKNRVPKFKNAIVQCNKDDEDMLLGHDVDNTAYWKLLAHKRFNCLLKTQQENDQVRFKLFETKLYFLNPAYIFQYPILRPKIFDGLINEEFLISAKLENSGKITFY